jgi:hypothetical protein
MSTAQRHAARVHPSADCGDQGDQMFFVKKIAQKAAQPFLC